jgi:hypothetical protein
MSLYPNSIPRCEHVKINGTQCGSPALKRNHFCYFHKRWQETRIVLNANRARRGRAALDLPVLEDANSIQVSLMQIMRLILSGQMDTKTAGLLLYALQTASSNLSRINFEPVVKTRVVIDPRTVDRTPLGEDPWRREDFEDEYEEDDQEEVAAQVKAKPEELPVDAEWVADEIIPNLEACAEEEEEPAQRSPVESVVSHPFRNERGKDGAPSVLLFGQKGKLGGATPASAVTDSRGGCGRIRGGRFRRGGTTSIGLASLPPPIPPFSESTCDGKS